MKTIIQSSFISLALCLTGVANADIIKIPVSEQAAELQSIDRPANGISMADVEARFGAPTEQTSAVGEPPIAKWTYDNFFVYFENNLVLHSVLRHTPQSEVETEKGAENTETTE